MPSNSRDETWLPRISLPAIDTTHSNTVDPLHFISLSFSELRLHTSAQCNTEEPQHFSLSFFIPEKEREKQRQTFQSQSPSPSPSASTVKPSFTIPHSSVTAIDITITVQSHRKITTLLPLPLPLPVPPLPLPIIHFISYIRLSAYTS